MKKCPHLSCCVYHGDLPCDCNISQYCYICKDGESVEFTVTKECKHQFFEIGRGKYRSEDYGFVDIVDQPNGIITMCALCGERRHLHADGRLEVLEKNE